MKLKSQTLFATAGLLAVLAAPAFGQVEPFLRPDKCDIDIKIPEGANGDYYTSKDCKTVFILPRTRSDIKVNSLALGATVNEFMCGRVFNQPKKMEAVEEQIAFLQKKINSLYDKRDERLGRNPEQEESINRTYASMITAAEVSMKSYMDMLADLEKGVPYSELEGAQVNLHLSVDIARDVTAYQEANKDSGLRFQAARIETGVLSFGITGEGKTKDIRILDAKIPGINMNGKSQFEDSRNVMFRGGLAGGMTLSQHSVCQMIHRLNREVFSENLLTEENMSTAGFIANYSYDVPVKTLMSFRLHGKVSAENIKTTFSGKLTSGKFTQKEISDVIYDGGLMKLLTVEYESGGIPSSVIAEDFKKSPLFSIDEDKNIINMFYKEGLNLFLKQVTDKLALVGMIRKVGEDDIEVVEGGDIVTKKTVRKCGKRRVRWGRSSKDCKDVTEEDRHYVAGNSTAERAATDNSSFEMDFSIAINDDVYMKHTTGFGEE